MLPNVPEMIEAHFGVHEWCDSKLFKYEIRKSIEFILKHSKSKV